MGDRSAIGNYADEGETTKVDLEEIKNARRSQVERLPAMTVVAGTQAGRVFVLDSFPAFVGRRKKNAVQLVGHGISRKHARLDTNDDGAVMISDTDSTNGTYVNGNMIRREVLEDDDVVQIGPSTVLKYSVEDSTEVRVRVRQYEQAIRDDLTGIFNRRYLLGALKHELAYAVRHDVSLSFVLMDMDQLKWINDTAGHDAGDAVIRSLSMLIASNLRTEDIFGRYGGDEFALILRGQDRNRAFESVDRLRRIVQKTPVEFADQTFDVSVSMGISSFTPGGVADEESMVKQADERLYEAKRAGGNRTVP